MHSLKELHASWLDNAFGDALHMCDPGASACGAYHLLVPVLHDLNILRSYSSYPDLIRNTVIERLERGIVPRVLVAGVASECSAAELLAVMQAFTPSPPITFLDRCRTPLNRIRRAIGSEDVGIDLLHLDLRSASKSPRRYDLILCDSLLKQFDTPARVAVLRTLAESWLTSEGIVVVREHYGQLSEIMARVWQRVPLEVNRAPFLGERHLKIVSDLLAQYQAHLEHRGPLYSDPPSIGNDFGAAGLRIVRMHTDVGSAFAAIVATPSH